MQDEREPMREYEFAACLKSAVSANERAAPRPTLIITASIDATPERRNRWLERSWFSVPSCAFEGDVLTRRRTEPNECNSERPDSEVLFAMAANRIWLLYSSPFMGACFRTVFSATEPVEEWRLACRAVDRFPFGHRFALACSRLFRAARRFAGVLALPPFFENSL